MSYQQKPTTASHNPLLMLAFLFAYSTCFGILLLFLPAYIALLTTFLAALVFTALSYRRAHLPLEGWIFYILAWASVVILTYATVLTNRHDAEDGIWWWSGAILTILLVSYLTGLYLLRKSRFR